MTPQMKISSWRSVYLKKSCNYWAGVGAVNSSLGAPNSSLRLLRNVVIVEPLPAIWLSYALPITAVLPNLLGAKTMLTMKKSSSCPLLHRNDSAIEEQQVQPMAIDNNNVEPDPILEQANNPTFDWLKAKVMELFRMLKLTHTGNQNLVSALQMN
ncbi:hypothetical protein RHSIM_Rhsim07G0175600 [Rhododendron simsii]|uniref:Uncharacterized protein n=1 Tax=Rhododendron simsii TaxID=118357 RepID=A0A834GKT2_RHOSS|nr:hypothetical protein RHSIM_Rhsim07G0175600 [Rhododendron simsii]